MRFLPSVEMTVMERSDNACAGYYRCAPFLPSVLSYLHVNNRHRVVAEDIDHLDRPLPTFSDLEHFADISKMFLNTMHAIETSQLGFSTTASKLR
jgi:hypothetical protein